MMNDKTWEEAAARWLAETGHKKTHKDDKVKIAWLHPHLAAEPLSRINRDRVDQIMAIKERHGIKPATVNKYLALIRAVLRRACHEWAWLDTPPRLRMRKVHGHRTRFLSRQEADRLILQLPAHLKAMALFSLNTGLRAGNVIHLQWLQVNLNARIAYIHPDQSKNGKAIGVPLNQAALQVLEEQKGRHPAYVFTYKSKPITSTSTRAWYKALQRAGIANFRWHDLRHTWASWHAQAGTPLSVLQELGGWKSAAMVQRYAHLTAGHLLKYAENIVDS